MKLPVILRGVGLGLAALALTVAIAFAWVWVYSIGVAPGHDAAFYQAYAERVAPICAIVAGVPILYAGGWLAARGTGTRWQLPALLPAITYVAIDAALLAALAAGQRPAAALLLLSWGSKLAAAWLGGRRQQPPGSAQ